MQPLVAKIELNYVNAGKEMGVCCTGLWEIETYSFFIQPTSLYTAGLYAYPYQRAGKSAIGTTDKNVVDIPLINYALVKLWRESNARMKPAHAV